VCLQDAGYGDRPRHRLYQEGHGHIVTFSVGANVSQGQVANIGSRNGFMGVSAEDGDPHIFSSKTALQVGYFILKPTVTLKSEPTIIPFDSSYLVKTDYYMKYLLLFFVSFCSSLSLRSQNIDSTIDQNQLVGIWQIKTPKMGDALLKNFQFFNDGRYILHFDSYDDTKRIFSISGRYRLEKRHLFLSITSRKELVGGQLIKGSPGFQRDEFVLDEGQIQEIKQDDTAGSDPFFIAVCGINKEGKINCIQIDNNKYYKLSSNPSQFDSHK
jgi:hypothetical protein